ncbi:unnamed protein product [Linum trigynum]|uniref:Uncharacterized protein n=1 Tax=Linum trigynum TaxID=586398 RepID=A0AAV2GKH0_9ROSI
MNRETIRSVEPLADSPSEKQTVANQERKTVVLSAAWGRRRLHRVIIFGCTESSSSDARSGGGGGCTELISGAVHNHPSSWPRWKLAAAAGLIGGRIEVGFG